MKRLIVFLSIIVLPFLAAGPVFAANITAPLSTPELRQALTAGKKSSVVFFQNPIGGPCRAQKEILEKLYADRKGNFNIVNVSTMKQEDQKAFYEYGIRNLPSLVLVDKKGNISRVYPPGIQSYETLAASLDGGK